MEATEVEKLNELFNHKDTGIFGVIVRPDHTTTVGIGQLSSTKMCQMILCLEELHKCLEELHNILKKEVVKKMINQDGQLRS